MHELPDLEVFSTNLKFHFEGKKLISLYCVLFTLTTTVYSQPFVDLLNIRYTSAFQSKNKSGTPFSHIYIGSDLPLKLKNNVLIVFSPLYENWNIDSASNKKFLPLISCIALPVSVVIPFNKKHWSLTVTAIPRFNNQGLKFDNSFQMGGALLASYKKNENLIYKFGIYLNNEFFGIFVVPLGGINWKINERNNLFGVLPGRITFEHKYNNNLYTGATFRSITNSYKLNNSNYLRIDDNQLSAFLDWYSTKHIVFTGEAGYGIMRQLRSGKGYNKNYLTDYNWGDGLFIRLDASYRIRL